MARLALISSPYVGAGSARALADALPDALAVDYGGVSSPDWYAGAAARIARGCDGRPWTAVLHSGAGGFAPALAAASRDLAGFIFLDAVLPYPGRSIVETAPEALIAQLRRLTTGGLLAAWNQWFDEDPTPRLIPDPATRAAFVAGLPRVPFAFLEARAPQDARWATLPAAYVQLSRNYEDQGREAERRGWPVRRARLNHLALVSEPRAVASLLDGLA